MEKAPGGAVPENLKPGFTRTWLNASVCETECLHGCFPPVLPSENILATREPGWRCTEVQDCLPVGVLVGVSHGNGLGLCHSETNHSTPRLRVSSVHLLWGNSGAQLL